MTKMIEAGTESPAEKTLYEIVTEGVQKILSAAVEEEVRKFLAQNANLKLPDERPRVVRNGYAKERELVLPTGRVECDEEQLKTWDAHCKSVYGAHGTSVSGEYEECLKTNRQRQCHRK